jgi:hypothetical protein
MNLQELLKLADTFDKLASEKKVYWKIKGTNAAGKHHTEVIYNSTVEGAKKSFKANNKGFDIVEASEAKDLKK